MKSYVKCIRKMLCSSRLQMHMFIGTTNVAPISQLQRCTWSLYMMAKPIGQRLSLTIDHASFRVAASLSSCGQKARTRSTQHASRLFVCNFFSLVLSHSSVQVGLVLTTHPWTSHKKGNYLSDNPTLCDKVHLKIPGINPEYRYVSS